jgi:hypothetical protein
MKDVVLVLALMAFFAVCVLYVRACERIMGPDDEVDAGDAVEPADSEAELLIDSVPGR